jgi:hypothetical protein
VSTPIRIARKHCANWQDGICGGIDFGPKGELLRFRPEGRQCLLSSRERCSYFETAVLPMRSQDWKNPSEGREFEEGADQYLRIHSGITGLAPRRRKCPDCGTQIGPKKRYCQACSNRRKLEADRVYQQKQRSCVDS